jgi:glycine betaine/proline transport system permease protein
MSDWRLPLGDWAEQIVRWMEHNLGFLLDLITQVFGGMFDAVNAVLTSVPALLMVLLISLLAFLLTRRLMLTIGVALALLLIDNMGLWSLSVETLSLVLVSAGVSIVIGVPIGIMCSRNNTLEGIVKVLLDFMQTMPSFVYLIPVVIFFGLGNVPGIIATIVFALPPTVRMTNLGIRQVPKELNEVADSFGSSHLQKLIMVQLPVAMTTIKAGINQCIMLSLSMVVIASMIGARGLGRNVLIAIQRIDIGLGFEAGLAIVIIAIILDRISQNAKGRS